MCGIAGFVSFISPPAADVVERIIKSQTHRGPDDAGIWPSPDGFCVLGANRLSIIDLSPAGHQPLLDEETGNAVVYNGEIYNFQELRREYAAKGYRFVSQTDTEVLLAAYREHGVRCLDRLRGMFAFAIWDARRARLFVARDRLGEKPVIYAPVPGGLVFGSEIASLVNGAMVDRSIDMEAVELLLELQHVPAPWTIFRQVRKLPPAHYGIFDRNGFRIERYWEVDYRQKAELSEQAASQRLEGLLGEAVRLRLQADVPVGSTLSGGVDSGLITALAACAQGTPVKTFTIAFKEKAFDESDFAAQVARRYKTDHKVLTVGPVLDEVLPAIVRHFGEPFADKGAVAAFYVSRLAKEHVKVALNGEGGDEIFGGYSRYELPQWRLWAGHLLDRWRDPRRSLVLAAEMQSWRHLVGRGARRLFMRYWTPDLQSVVSPAYWCGGLRRELLDGHSGSVVESWRADWVERALKFANDPVDRMLWLDLHTYLADNGLVKMDIASMHCSLEARAPFVDHKLVEFCATLPIGFKVRHGLGKYLLKQVARKYVPPSIVERRKQGFAIPVDEWLRGPLWPWVAEYVMSPQLMEPFRMDAVRRVVTEFQRGEGDHAYRVWLLLVYGVWRRLALGDL